MFVAVLGLVGLAYGIPANSVTYSTAASQRVVNRADARARLNTAFGRLPLSFEENRGQADPRVRFLSHGHGYRMFVTTTETVLVLRGPSGLTRRPVEKSAAAREMHADGAGSTPTVVTMRLV